MFNPKFISSRDVLFLKGAARELASDISSVGVTFFRLKGDTPSNFYGEIPRGYVPEYDRYEMAVKVQYDAPEQKSDDGTLDVTQRIQVSVLYSICVDMEYLPLPGDLVTWNGDLFEIDTSTQNQFIADVANIDSDFSVQIAAHRTSKEKYGIK